jgi:hypothetical protein
VSRGGKRSGAGRKPGGGIAAVKVLRTEARALLAEIVGTDRDPLMVAIDIATDKSQPTPLRLEAALGAARYLHPTLSAQAVAHVGKPADASGVLSVIMDRFAKLTAPAPTIDMLVEEKATA